MNDQAPNLRKGFDDLLLGAKVRELVRQQESEDKEACPVVCQSCGVRYDESLARLCPGCSHLELTVRLATEGGYDPTKRGYVPAGGTEQGTPPQGGTGVVEEGGQTNAERHMVNQTASVINRMALAANVTPLVMIERMVAAVEAWGAPSPSLWEGSARLVQLCTIIPRWYDLTTDEVVRLRVTRIERKDGGE